MERKKPARKAEPQTKRGIAWPRWTGFREKTVWDWLQLFIVPLALVLIGLAFSMQQDARQQQIEDQRAQAERELAEQRAQDEALQAYLDQMGQLLLEKDLRNAEEGSAARTLARARTLAVMQRLDADRNQTIARFLTESKLVETDGTTTGLLKGASLEEANLERVALSGADLSSADLRGADLSKARGSTEEQLSAAKTLEGATMPDGQELKGYTNPDGPTFEDWRKSKGSGEDGGQ